MLTSVSAVLSAWVSSWIAHGPARSASGFPPPIRRGPTGTTRVAARTASGIRSAADGGGVDPDFAGPIELVVRRFPADLGVLPLELTAHALGVRLVELRELLDDSLDAEPLRGRRAALAHLVDARRRLGHW